jgi:hypothetical protein
MNITDIQLVKDIFTTMQLKTYSKGSLADWTRLARAAIVSVEKEIRSRLTPEQNEIRIVYCFKNLKTKNTHGRCRRNSDKLITIYINPKSIKDHKQMAETIGHELVHAEQYMTDKLAIDAGYHRWNGNKVVNKGSTYSAYRSQPWEIEAFEQQSKNAEKILSTFHQMRAQEVVDFIP